MEYFPDKWLVIKIETPQQEKGIYKIFASWAGSYTTGDSWKVNSGIKDCVLIHDTYSFYGHSGSVYKCHKDNYGIIGNYNISILKTTQDSLRKAGTILEVLLDRNDWSSFFKEFL